jgi:hypothetical protein
MQETMAAKLRGAIAEASIQVGEEIQATHKAEMG